MTDITGIGSKFASLELYFSLHGAETQKIVIVRTRELDQT